MINFVKQQDQTGCAIACIAMVIKNNYQATKQILAASKLVPRKWSSGNYALNCNNIFNILQYLGIKCSEPITNNFAMGNFDNHSIIGIRNLNFSSCYKAHGLVFCCVSRYLFDPKIGVLSQVLYNRYKKMFYIKVFDDISKRAF